MRMSCNGCRVLRKGCNEDCVLRPCLEWINSPHSQANATLFLAKFYGRAGLFNLIRPSPLHLRPGIFRSLLYEACGRIINPVYGSVGLMSSGSWEQCQSAVDSVLNGTAIMQLSSDHYGNDNAAVVVANCDIRHLSKDSGNRMLPPGRDHGKAVESPNEEDHRRSSSIFGWNREDLQGGGDELNFCSVGTVEPTLVSGGGGGRPETCGNDRTDEVVLELTLGWD